MRRNLNESCKIVRASLWLALAWLVLISPSFAQGEQWARLDDARQPAAQATPAMCAAAARPPGDDGATVALQPGSPAPRPVSAATQDVAGHYRCDLFVSVAAFDPRAPPRA